MTAIEKERLDVMEDKLTDVSDKVDQILAALKGDELGLSGGLVPEMKMLKVRILKLETLKNRVIWMAAGAGASGGIGIVKIIQWIQESAK